MKPLSTIKVLDLSKVFAGPLCGQYLGDLGADVIKVEPVEGGDDTRGWMPQELGQSATFLALNHNKRSLAVDLKTDEGRAIVHRLATESDVVIQGFGGGTAERLNVDYRTLSALNPTMIYCEISGYGRQGPLGDRPGYDVMLQAFSGMISTMGDPAGAHARASFSPVDLGTGMHATTGVLAALLERSKTGRGVYLEISLLDSALGFMTYLAQNYWRTGEIPQRMGTAHPSLAPYQAFSAADGSLMVGAGNDGQWRKLCGVLGLTELAEHPNFATNAARVRNFAATVAHVQNKICERPVGYWLQILEDAGLPCAPIHTLDQALNHPQVGARDMIVETDHPVIGKLKHLGYPVTFNREPRSQLRTPPLHGQHTREILVEFGFNDEAINGLASRNIVKLG